VEHYWLQLSRSSTVIGKPALWTLKCTFLPHTFPTRKYTRQWEAWAPPIFNFTSDTWETRQTFSRKIWRGCLEDLWVYAGQLKQIEKKLNRRAQTDFINISMNQWWRLVNTVMNLFSLSLAPLLGSSLLPYWSTRLITQFLDPSKAVGLHGRVIS
jgi:hypothetical protein